MPSVVNSGCFNGGGTLPNKAVVELFFEKVGTLKGDSVFFLNNPVLASKSFAYLFLLSRVCIRLMPFYYSFLSSSIIFSLLPTKSL